MKSIIYLGSFKLPSILLRVIVMGARSEIYLMFCTYFLASLYQQQQVLCPS